MTRHILAFTIPHARKLILSGRKSQTLRLAERWGHVEIEDSLSLRQWIGRPRQSGSRQEHIATVTVREVEHYVFRLDMPTRAIYHRPYPDLALKALSEGQKARLAERDGFDSFKELAETLVGFYGKTARQMVALGWRPIRLALAYETRNSATDNLNDEFVAGNPDA